MFTAATAKYNLQMVSLVRRKSGRFAQAPLLSKPSPTARVNVEPMPRPSGSSFTLIKVHITTVTFFFPRKEGGAFLVFFFSSLPRSSYLKLASDVERVAGHRTAPAGLTAKIYLEKDSLPARLSRESAMVLIFRSQFVQVSTNSNFIVLIER